jgi:putative colanic acid biosynthesis acetyltransferase WcaF
VLPRSLDRPAHVTGIPSVDESENRGLQTDIGPQAPRAEREALRVMASPSTGDKARRFLWQVTWLLFYRYSPVLLHGWRRFILRCCGAKVGAGAHPYPQVRIWAPWNLVMAEGSCLANGVDCYNVAPVVLHRKALVSQYSYICTASHDYENPAFPLMAATITIGPYSWIAADAFVGPGVMVGEGAVVAARATVVKNVAAWTVVAGNPAREIKRRVLDGAMIDSIPAESR